MMRSLRRFLAMLLCVVMVVGLIPASVTSVFAADETIYVLAGGDFQEAGDHANSAANVTNILTKISDAGYTTMDGFLFIGDYDCETHDSATETANGITALMGAVQGKYSNLVDSNSILAQGNHDYMDSRIDATGGHDLDVNGDDIFDYSAYVLNEDDYPNNGGSQSGVQTLANNLKTWLNDKIGEGYEAPIFIVSHLPLAFTPRTVTQGDAKYAKYIFDVLNDAAANGLNIIFLHGHDHAYGPDNYMGGEAIYLPEGHKICIAEEGSTSKWTEETLNFTYMNAGYTGYYSDPYTYVTTAGTDKLTMTVFAITDNQVTVERYSANGVYNLKSAGYDGSYSDTSVTNASLGLPTYSDVYASPQTITLAEAQDYGATIGNWVGIEAETPADDVTTANNGWVEITAPVNGNSGTDDVTTSGNSWVTIKAPVEGKDEVPEVKQYQYTLDTNGVDAGAAYLIVGSGNAKAMGNGTLTATDVTLTNNGANVLMSGNTAADFEWTITSDGKITNGTQYLVCTGSGSTSPTASISVSTDSGAATVWTIVSNGDGTYKISYTFEYGRLWVREATTYLYYSNNAFGVTTNPNSVPSVRLYGGGQSVTTQEYQAAVTAENGLYGYVSGDLTYNFSVGTDADTALAAVKAGIEVRYLEAMSTPGSNASYLVADDGIITWELDPNYNANTPGDYVVTISYDGTVLGKAEVVLSSGDTNGEYAKLVGGLSYTVTPGTDADTALAAVKAGIDGYTYAGMSAPAGDAGTKLDDSALSWTLDPTYDPNVPGDYAVTVYYNGKHLGTAEVIVPAATTYYIAEGNGLYLVDMNTSADNAMAAVKAGITVYSAADETGTNKTAISDDDVTWNWVDTYNGADSGPYTVEILKDGTSLGTVEVKVNIKYETGIETDWTYIGESEATGGTHTYTLDTDGIDSDGQYIIVAEDQALALHTSGSSAATAVSVTISSDGKTLTTDTRDYEYYWNSTYGFTRDGYNGLYQSSWAIYLGEKSASYLDGVVNHNNGTYTLYDNEGNERGLYYSGSAWTVNNGGTTTDYKVRLYKYTGTTGGTPAGSIYAKIEGNTVYTVPQGTSATKALAAVKEGITAYLASDENGSDKTELADNDSKLKWTWLNTYNSNSTGSYWVQISYDGEVLGTVEVRVEPGVVNNYPEYPNEGAVKVNKTATGVDFQSSGIAQVEVSASGVPIKKGVDVVVMVDTSSSMESWCVCGTQNCTDTGTIEGSAEGAVHARRSAVLEDSLKSLITQFKTPGDDGKVLDIDIAIADFNGFYGENHNSSGTAYDRDAADMMSDEISYNANSEAQIYTGTKELAAGAFIPVEDLAASYTLNYTSGTNYDYAMDAIYQLATAKQIANGGEERDLYVIFLSDGAPMQWNYYHAQGQSSLWNSWITGAWDADDLTTTNLNCTTHAYYYDEVDHDGDGQLNEHRMANAIKGDPSQNYEVIRKTDDLGTATGETNMYMVPGLGATMFAISFGAQDDGNVTKESMHIAIDSLASPEDDSTTPYHYHVTTAAELTSAFNTIGAEIAYAASNARFVDQMGGQYNLQLKLAEYDVVDGETTTTKTLSPVIEILSYDIYTRQDYLNGTITEDKIGDRKGTSSLLEVVKFSDDGTKAYSSLVDVDKDGTYGVTVSNGTYTISDTDDNIFGADGIIYAKTFLYNTKPTAVTVTGVDIPTGDKSDGTTTGSSTSVPSEAFYWKMGTVQTTELAMRYYVYLEGSMEGTLEAGSYPTNEFAILYYDNYLGNPCFKETVSPVMAWKEANVSYAFYLVDADGKIIVNQTTGATGSFANKIAVTNPVVYETVLLNNDEEVSSIDIASLGVLPEGYTLYDYNGTNGATYTVTINSNTTGSWNITSVKDVHTTYVMQHDPNDPSAYSNALQDGIDADGNTVITGHDYTHTIVWFAVLWEVQALPDSVVVDYGLPVDIHVLTNDMFGDYGKLAGVGAYSDSLNLTGFDAANALTATTHNGKYGTAKANLTSGTIRYTLNTMQVDSYDKFAYSVSYTGAENPGYYYDTVTVIPATTIYYEDSLLTYTASNTAWENVGTSVGDVTQDEDRPGQYSLTDANNIYGFDHINEGMSTFSLGTAKKVHVDADSFATAKFTFAGTGFDVIGMTSNTTGTLTIKVLDAAGNKVAAKAVNTYYGYTKNGDEWVATPDVDNALYQVPVMQVNNLTYGTYTVTITATYAAALDKTTADGYDLYLDAIRIYDPANDGAQDSDTVIEDAYAADGESWPTYVELRPQLINQTTLGNADTATEVVGLVFIDGDSEVGNDQIEDYQGYGPNNEVYLAPGQRVAFLVDTPDNLANIHIGISSADGQKGTYTITNIAQSTNSESKVNAGDYYNAKTDTVETTTDMYYDLTGWKGDIIVISNTGNLYGTTGVISLTNIKTTYTSDPTASAQTFGLFMTPRAANLMLMSLNTSEPVEDTTTNGNTPEVEVPETEPTEPEDTVTGETNAPEADDTVTEDNTNNEVDTPVTEDNGTTEIPEDTETDKPAEEQPEVETPEEEIPEEETPEVDLPTEEPAEQLGFWARLWNAIKDAFSRLFSWIRF